MHLEFLLEERSAEVALRAILPKIVSFDVSHRFHVFQGKHDLLKQLPVRLKSYRLKIRNDCRIVVLVDEDRENCHQLKAELEHIAHDEGFVTKSSAARHSDFQVVNRLAIEELEAWFFGDPKAIRAAYPKIPDGFHRWREYQNPDAIADGTCEALERLLRQFYRRRYAKTKMARMIAPHMEPDRNKSKSFQVFVEGVKACVGEGILRN